MELSYAHARLNSRPPCELITRRIQLALDTFGDCVKESWVYLMDLNGPKGGVDKLCQLGVHVRRVGDIVVRESGSTSPAALNRAARRLKYRVSEALRHADRPSCVLRSIAGISSTKACTRR
jgi:putative sigma-54 modulation protein